jgi:hypothetical protein
MAWEQSRIRDIESKLTHDPVYNAVGDKLKEAMIAQEVVYVMNAVCDVDFENPMTAKRISDLYFATVQKMLPHVYCPFPGNEKL